jgi:hypothetical protein
MGELSRYLWRCMARSGGDDLDMVRTTTGRRWRRLGWLLVTPLLMGESFCPATCSNAFSRGIDKATAPLPERAWTVSRKQWGTVAFTSALPQRVFEVTVAVATPEKATYAARVDFQARVTPPGPLSKDCGQPVCGGYKVCMTERDKTGYPPAQLAYPMVDAKLMSTYLQATFTADGGRPLNFGRTCGEKYDCKYGGETTPTACSGYVFRASFDPANPGSMTRDPSTGRYVAKFRMTLTATDPPARSYAALILSGRPVPWENDYPYPTNVEITADIYGPEVKRGTPQDQRPPAPTLQLDWRVVE